MKKFLKSKTGYTFYRIIDKNHMSISIFPNSTQCIHQEGIIYTIYFLKENFVKSTEKEFNQALEKVLHNIKNNLL